MNLHKDKYIIVEVIPTHSDSTKGTIAQISALKLDGIKLVDRFDYRLKDELIDNDDKTQISNIELDIDQLDLCIHKKQNVQYM